MDLKISKKCSWEVLSLLLIVCLGIGALGGWATQQSVHTWYPTLTKPFWTPPAWIFPIVWTLLYVMIAIAGWLIYCAQPSALRTLALSAYGMQLVLNLMWSFLFFWMRSPLLGLVDMMFLWMLIILTLGTAWRVRPLAGLLLVPYLIWVTYAATLNVGIWLMNP